MKVLFSLVLLSALAGQKSFAYGVRTMEKVVVQTVDCEYKVVDLKLRNGKTMTAIQNLTPMHVKADFINTSKDQGRRNLGRTDLTISMNELIVAAGNAVYAEALPNPSDAGRFDSKQYFYDATAVQSELLADRINTCKIFEQAKDQGAVLDGPYLIPGLVTSAVIEKNETTAIDPTNDGLAIVEFSLHSQFQSALRELIKNQAYCVQGFDNEGSIVARLKDGTPVDRCQL